MDSSQAPILAAIGRTCGACTACCHVAGVAALDKPAYVTCTHACTTGCAIYPRRPTECQDYSCLWLVAGFGGEEDRPDRIGLMLDLPADVEDHVHYQGIPVVCARELRPGSREGERARSMLTRLAAKMIVRLVPPIGKPQLLGPRDLIARLSSRVRGDE